jgi:PAS domain S-box-containing protein
VKDAAVNQTNNENDDSHGESVMPVLEDVKFLAGGGAMGALIRAHDWSSTLGSPHTWPQSLRTAVRLMLTTNHPIFIFWGPEHICLYNDAFSASLGPEMHPAMLGEPGRDMWQAIWDVVLPQIEAVMAGHGATWNEDKSLPFYRHGALEEMFWTYSSSPIDDEQAPNGIGGVMVLCVETTQKVVASRHQEFRLRLETALRDLRRPLDIVSESTRLLGEFLQARRCGFAEAEMDSDFLLVRADCTDSESPRLGGRIHLAEFGPDFIARHGNAEPVLVEEPMAETARSGQVMFATQTHAPCGIAMPLLKNGRLAAILYAYRSNSRRWTEHHELLIRDVAKRTMDAVERARIAAERDRAMAELRDSETRYRSLVEASAAIVWQRSASGEFDTPQPGWTDFTGQSFEELKGWGWLSAVHPDDQDRVAEMLGHAFEQGVNYHIEYRLRRRDGEYRSMLVRAVTVKNTNGSLQGWVGTHNEVATTTQSGKGSGASSQLGRSDASPHATWMAAADGRWQYLSDRWREWTGAADSPADWCATVHPQERDLVLAAWRRAVASGAHYDMEYRVRWSTGDYRWVHARAQPHRDAAGKIVSWSGTIEDIHDWLIDHDISQRQELPIGTAHLHRD